MDMDVGITSISDGEGCEESQISNNDPRCDPSSGAGKLKRSCSAPMINQLLPQSHGLTSTSPLPNRDSATNDIIGIQPRVRRMSANFGPVSPLSPGSSRIPGRMRVSQLREEEGMDVVNREAAHERTVHSSLQVDETLSQSWEDLALTEERKPSTCHSLRQPKKDFSDQLSLTISPIGNSQGNACGASPTRVGRQCFSPSLQQQVRNSTFCPSPSPTKKTFTTRRSLSPIPLRPSPLGGRKRKYDIEDSFITPNKRLSTSATPDRCTGGGLLIAHPHNSIGSLESTPSPAGPGSIGSVGTPESVCSSGSPGPQVASYSPAQTPDTPAHLFKPVSPAMVSVSHGSSNFGCSIGDSSFGGGKGSSSLGEGSDTSCDAMITEETSTQDLKTFQAMDLSESLPSVPQNRLNI